MIKNIFSSIPKDIPKELFETIVSSKEIRIERIISKGHITENNKWYNQDKNEFVIVLKGSAVIEYKNNEMINLGIGDYLIIPARKEHRVAETSKKEETIWLAVFYQ